MKHILLAEDNTNDIALTLSALGESRLTNPVDVVRDGAEALDYLFCRDRYIRRSTGLPAVLLLDIKMPRVDGHEVLQQVKADSSLRRMPVVMLTSSREEQDLIRSYDLGVNAFVVKPVDFGQFVEAIGRIGVFWAIMNEAPRGPGNLP